MNFRLNNNNIDSNSVKGIQLCDYIEVIDMNDDVYSYNVFYSKEYGFCLIIEDEPLIKFLHLNHSKLEIFYVNGDVKIMNTPVKSVEVDDHWLFKKNKSFTIDGTLLQYDNEMGIKYGLNSEEHYNKYPKVYEKDIKRKVKQLIKGE